MHFYLVYWGGQGKKSKAGDKKVACEQKKQIYHTSVEFRRFTALFVMNEQYFKNASDPKSLVYT